MYISITLHEESYLQHTGTIIPKGYRRTNVRLLYRVGIGLTATKKLKLS